MLRITRIYLFVKGESLISLVSATIVFTVVAYANHIEAKGGQYNLIPVALIAGMTAGALSAANGWRNRERSARVDASHSHTYYQEIKVRSALSTISMVNSMCEHQFDTDHHKCRAAVMAQLQIIKSAYGGGPDPQLIIGGKASNCKEPDPVHDPSRDRRGIETGVH